jgi:hypothetical protein
VIGYLLQKRYNDAWELIVYRWDMILNNYLIMAGFALKNAENLSDI